jgi:hypothetical protein
MSMDTKHSSKAISKAAAMVVRSLTGKQATKAAKSSPVPKVTFGNSTLVTAPAAQAHILRAPSSVVCHPTLSYNMGTLIIGNGVLGVANNVYFLPTNTSTYVSFQAVPVAPADLQSIGTAQGYGSVACNAMLSLFERRRYRRLIVSVEPIGLGASSTSGVSIAFAPVRGAQPGTYQLQSNAAHASVPTANVLSMEGGVSFPSWKPMRFDMTKYISGGSGPMQNEFCVSSASGGVSIANSGSVYATKPEIPCAMVFGGIATTGNGGAQIALVRCEFDVDLLDWLGDTGLATAGSANVTTSAPASAAVAPNVVVREQKGGASKSNDYSPTGEIDFEYVDRTDFKSPPSSRAETPGTGPSVTYARVLAGDLRKPTLTRETPFPAVPPTKG